MRISVKAFNYTFLAIRNKCQNACHNQTLAIKISNFTLLYLRLNKAKITIFSIFCSVDIWRCCKCLGQGPGQNWRRAGQTLPFLTILHEWKCAFKIVKEIQIFRYNMRTLINKYLFIYLYFVYTTVLTLCL